MGRRSAPPSRAPVLPAPGCNLQLQPCNSSGIPRIPILVRPVPVQDAPPRSHSLHGCDFREGCSRVGNDVKAVSDSATVTESAEYKSLSVALVPSRGIEVSGSRHSYTFTSHVCTISTPRSASTHWSFDACRTHATADVSGRLGGQGSRHCGAVQGAKEESRGEEAGGAHSSLANLLLPALILIGGGGEPKLSAFFSVLLDPAELSFAGRPRNWNFQPKAVTAGRDQLVDCGVRNWGLTFERGRLRNGDRKT